MRIHRPVVFVHGLIGPLLTDDVRLYFADRETLAPDLLGYGSERQTPLSRITLEHQAEHLHRAIVLAFGNRPVSLVGHSVGGAISMLVASRHSECVAELVSVEGNFTLNDAFWSASLSRMTPDDADFMMSNFRADPGAWLAGAGVEPTAERLVLATAWLTHQSGSTLRAMGSAVVQTTGAESYSGIVRSVFARIPVHLIAGERSVTNWDVPSWASDNAASWAIIPKAGHMMMLEDPKAFSECILSALR